MGVKIVIPGTLPSMNEIIKSAKAHYGTYSTLKKYHTGLVAMVSARTPRQQRVDVKNTWYCRDRRRDKDNIMAGQKFIFDGLMAAGVISNDGWKDVGDITHSFVVDKANPRIEVELIGVE